jgi:GNAT superfamily N-acetyltransferase
MVLREAIEEDLDEICSLIDELADYEQLAHEVEYDRERMRAELFGVAPAAQVTLAVAEDGSVAGMALWFRTFSTFLGRSGIWLEDLFVRPVHRRSGVASALIGHLRTLTDGRVEWAVLDWNEDALSFYRGLGAEAVDGWTRYRISPA